MFQLRLFDEDSDEMIECASGTEWFGLIRARWSATIRKTNGYCSALTEGEQAMDMIDRSLKIAGYGIEQRRAIIAKKFAVSIWHVRLTLDEIFDVVTALCVDAEFGNLQRDYRRNRQWQWRGLSEIQSHGGDNLLAEYVENLFEWAERSEGLTACL